MNGTNGINAEKAWDISTGDHRVRVGIIDTGISNHDDLNANLVSGWDFYNNNGTTNDDQVGHGTHVAGTIGATGSNTNGVAGVSWNVQLVPLQVVDNAGKWPLDAVTSAITWAINNNVDIINYSGGGTSDNATRRNAISNFKGLFVCASGNDNTNNDATRYYPSDYSRGQNFSQRVISVGAIDNNGSRASFSNYGADSVSLFAPGSAILSTSNAGGYTYKSGTSMATPHVTGAAALMFSLYLSKPNNMSRADMSSCIKEAMINNVMGSNFNGNCVSGGILNVYDAITDIPIRNRAFDNFGYNGSTYYWNGEVDLTIGKAHAIELSPTNDIIINKATTLDFYLNTKSSSNAWSVINGTVSYELKLNDEILKTHVSTVKVDLLNKVSLDNRLFSINTNTLKFGTQTYTLTLTSVMNRASWTDTDVKTFTFTMNNPSACIADNSLITLADGSQKAVELLTGDEKLLVWNLKTGQFDTAPILFIDSDARANYEVINLTFSDGTTVKVISEHGFWDITLNKYVFLRNDAAQYIGHWFNKQTTDANGNMTWTAVQLTSVVVSNEVTTSWSPVTYEYLCYYVNGMLSMPGATTGLINIFEVNAETMQYDQEMMQADIEEYGLFTYEEFAEILPVPENIFEAFGGQYFKVAMGKGLLTWDTIQSLVERYAEFF